jgi:hypothetical protein
LVIGFVFEVGALIRIPIIYFIVTKMEI